MARSPGGWEVSVSDVQLNEVGHEVFGSKSLVLLFPPIFRQSLRTSLDA